MPHTSSVDTALARIQTQDAGGVLAVLIGQLRDFDLAEDALQDAMAEALVAWRRDGLPRNCSGWLLTVARRRAIDRIRRSATAQKDANRQEILRQLEHRDDEAEADHPIPDERLRLVFTCCHPALRQEAQVALTLRTLCGLSTAEIARAYLVSDTSMSQRLVRAKHKIRTTAIPYAVPEGSALGERLASVLDVIYLIFNEGFAATQGAQTTRADLCLEAIRLGRIVYQLMPLPETGGLLALMLLHDARRPARADGTGAYIPISEQDRHLWNQDLIDEGKTLLLACLGQRRPGPFQIQAAISAVHADANHAQETDWPQIAGLYAALSAMTPSPIVTLNHAVALANAVDANAGLALLETVGEALADYQPLHAARADLLKRSGRTGEAIIAYDRAIALSTNTAGRNFLLRKRNEISVGVS